MSQGGILQDNGTAAADVETLTGNTGGAVSPTLVAGKENINIVGSGAITVTGNPGTHTLTISSGAGPIVVGYTSVNHAASPYTVLSTDYYLAVDTSGGVVTLNFPNTTTTARTFVVKDTTGTSGTNAITVTTPGGAVTFDGVTSYTMNSNYISIQLLFNGTNYEVY